MGINLSDYEINMKEVLNELVQGINGEVVRKNEGLRDRLQKEYARNPVQFLDFVEHTQLNFLILVEDVLGVETSENSYMLEHIVSGLYEHFHEQRVERLEGFSFSADKSQYIKDKTLQAIKENKNLSLYSDYEQIDHMKGKYEGRAYWSPTSVTDTDEAIELFINWYQQKEDEK